jgi:hypothetical protein
MVAITVDGLADPHAPTLIDANADAEEPGLGTSQP